MTEPFATLSTFAASVPDGWVPETPEPRNVGAETLPVFAWSFVSGTLRMIFVSERSGVLISLQRASGVAALEEDEVLLSLREWWPGRRAEVTMTTRRAHVRLVG